MNLVKSEWRKLIYARANWGLLIAAVLIGVLSTAVTPIILDQQGEMFGFGLESQQAVDSVYANAISGYIFAIILGILLMAGEFRHGTAVATFLTAPKRGTVLGAKLAVAAIAGSLLMVISTGVAIIAGVAVLAAYPEAAEVSDGVFLNTMIAGALSGAILAIVGVAIGTLVRNQMLAIVGALVYLFIIDPVLLMLWADAGKWLPSGLITAMMSLDIQSPELGFDTTQYLPALTATIVMLGYGVVFAAIAIATSLRRDVE